MIEFVFFLCTASALEKAGWGCFAPAYSASLHILGTSAAVRRRVTWEKAAKKKSGFAAEMSFREESLRQVE